jgi:DNA-binding NarL/FixJ family response regulator
MRVHVAPIRVRIVESAPLLRDAMTSLIDGADGLSVVSASATISEAIPGNVETLADIMLVTVCQDASFFSAVEEAARRVKGLKLVFLDERTVDSHVHEALRIAVAGYLTRQQPFREIASALRMIVSGQRVIAPEVSDRLIFSSSGLRLVSADRRRTTAMLSPRELQVLALLAQGCTVKKCASLIGIGASTTGNHKSRLMKKLNVYKTVELTHLAIREGLIEIGRPLHDCLERAPSVS